MVGVVPRTASSKRTTVDACATRTGFSISSARSILDRIELPSGSLVFWRGWLPRWSRTGSVRRSTRACEVSDVRPVEVVPVWPRPSLPDSPHVLPSRDDVAHTRVNVRHVALGGGPEQIECSLPASSRPDDDDLDRAAAIRHRMGGATPSTRSQPAAYPGCADASLRRPSRDGDAGHPLCSSAQLAENPSVADGVDDADLPRPHHGA
jgi:hypothetical protein